ncbi:unnamed protein product [Didymodactylos carnosus]|uniref:Uncharacterized protein n=1 Tax=Didymodactylos carnosus TaxID=1234261 RepID=A0A814R5E2_9BILA|nr:unnamed protein product [Didymodactylos carnosus]CAF1127326.1 unnamed protein product [Didymodactylos carnosus]CAF3605818.1 unnamed protein product [Didymodactylos carnosus]CAF3890922.1 unnamed protein product [Didymodactylos carnosus]
MPQLRTNAVYDNAIKILEDKNKSQLNSKHERCRRRRINKGLRSKQQGYHGVCHLRKLRYFDVGLSFLFDSLHNAYHGTFKRLLKLWLDNSYKNERWSCASKFKDIAEKLNSIYYPSTTSRTPRQLEKYLKFKGSEERLVLLFGFEAFRNFLLKNYYEHHLLFVMAVHKAENRSISSIDVLEIKELLTQYHHQFPKLYGLITRTINATKNHSLEIQNTLNLFRLAWHESESDEFNKTLKIFIESLTTTKRVGYKSNRSTAANALIPKKKTHLSPTRLASLQVKFNCLNIVAFQTLYIATTRFTTQDFGQGNRTSDSLILFESDGRQHIGFIQNIIKYQQQFALMVKTATIIDCLRVFIGETQYSTTNVTYGNFESDTILFIEPHQVIEKLCYSYDKTKKNYTFFRYPTLEESS